MGGAQFAQSGLDVMLALSEWVEYQYGNWQRWAAGRDAGWLGLDTGNERFPKIGDLYLHAFTPLRRYSDQAAGLDPSDDSHVDTQNWSSLGSWAWECIQAHRTFLSTMEQGWLDRILDFKTRSAGVMKVSLGGALTHATTHCVWHLAGITHLLRREGIEPPDRSDMIFWLAGFNAMESKG